MKLSDFDFELPEQLIALRPVSPRPASRMLVSQAGVITDAHASDLPEFLREGDMLVFNDTKVLAARLSGTRTRATEHGSGIARIEVTLAEPQPDGKWLVLARPAKRLKQGDIIEFADGFTGQVREKLEDGKAVLDFDMDAERLQGLLDQHGMMPLPPYIAGKRQTDARDREDYQSVFARIPGAVAAPTASLHFDEGLLERLAGRGIKSAHLTLHVGAGTFLPVKVDDVSTHKMHAEWGEITAKTAEAINAVKADGGRVIPVGTTALRLLESAAVAKGQVGAWRGTTDIFIRPGFEFRVADGLMTNFHLPKSTLLMLVSALAGRETIREIYAHAVTREYRFFSYGDTSLLLP